MKIQLKNWILLFFFTKFVPQNRAFPNNTIFLERFFGFGGGGFPVPPLNPPVAFVIVSGYLPIRNMLIS